MAIAAAGTAQLDPSENRALTWRFIRLASRFWTGETQRAAWLSSVGFLATLLASLILAVALNQWSKYFFDSIQSGDQSGLNKSIAIVIALAFMSAVLSAALVQARMRLQLRWREWLSRTLIIKWLQDSHVEEGGLSKSTDNPEARIADDGRLSTELLVDIAGGIINSVLAAIAFVVILWNVGGPITVWGVTFHGYLVFAVIAYSAVVSSGMYRLAGPLVQRVEAKAAGEGDFRFALTRTREKADAALLTDGDAADGDALERSFGELARRWHAVIRRQSQMALLSSSSGVLAPVVPLILGAPKYLSGAMTLGDLMQSAAAFWQVYLALNWLADNALSIANWSASARRVAALHEHYQQRQWRPS